MFNNLDFNKILPHIAAVALFVVLSLIYFSPVLEGMKLKQHDIENFKGMSKDIVEHRDLYDEEEPLWGSGMFAGMPGYQISVKHPNTFLRTVDKVLQLGLPRPAGYVFLYMLGFYILLMCLKVDPWLSIVGAIAFGFSSYFLIILGAGHNSKAHAIAYMAPVLGGILMSLRGRYWIGGIIATLFLSLEIYTNHLQITYYLFLVVVFVGIAELISAITQDRLASFLKGSGVLVIAAMLAVGANFSNLYTTYEYGKATMRGSGELTLEPNGQPKSASETQGLSIEYVTAWSYGTGETYTLLVPDAKGGKSGQLGSDHPSIDAVDVPRQYIPNVAQSNTYWGNQGGTSGPVYVGAVVFFLFIMGLFYLRGTVHWALLLVSILAILLSWGKNYIGFTEFFMDYVPGYNKFRAVTIILVIVELALPIIGIMWLQQLLKHREKFAQNLTPMYIGGGLLLFGLLITAVAPGTFFNFMSNQELSAYGDYIANLKASGDGVNANNMEMLLQHLQDVRMNIFSKDVWRSILFVVLAGGVVWAYLKGHLTRWIMIPAIGLLVLIDLWAVDKRYLNNEEDDRGSYISWVDPEFKSRPFPATAVDNAIYNAEAQLNPEIATMAATAEQQLQAEKRESGDAAIITNGEREDIKFRSLRQKTNFRVLNLSVSTFNDASTSFHFKSIGGYHGAKLKRYQDVIDWHIYPVVGTIQNLAQSNPAAVDQQLVQQYMANASVLNMLNTKYVIFVTEVQPGQSGLSVAQNPYALGDAWFVDEVKQVPNADEEIQAMRQFDPSRTAIVDQRYAGQLKPFTKDPAARIALTQFKNNHMVYQTSAASDQMAVFSEVFYDTDWQAYIDGQPVDHARVNYILRGLMVPAGEHTIEFKIESKAFNTGSTMSLVSTILMLLVMGGLGWMAYKSRNPEQEVAA